MSISFLIMFFFGISILISWAGLGTLINYILFPQIIQDIWLRTGWGLCLTLIIGGILNIAGIISPAAIFIVIGVGIFILFLHMYSIKGKFLTNIENIVRDEKRDYLSILLYVIISTMLIVIYLGSISNIHYLAWFCSG